MRLTTVSSRACLRASGRRESSESRHPEPCESAAHAPRAQHLGARSASTYAEPAREIANRRVRQNAVPRDWFPAGMPATQAEWSAPSSIATSQRTGRTKRSFGFAPVHILRPVDCGDLLRQTVGQNLRGGAAFLRDLRGQVLALRSRDSSPLRDIDSSFFRKGMRGRRRLAILVRNLHRRTVTCSVTSS